MSTGTTVCLLSTPAVKAPLVDTILPDYKKASGVALDSVFEPTALLVKRIYGGQRPDVMIATSESFDQLVAAGLIDGPSQTPIVKAGIGIAVAAGTDWPNISSTDSFVSTMLRARSVAYSRAGASGIYFSELIEKLGIAAELNTKATIIERGLTGDALLDGRADIAVQMLSELRLVTGADIVGPLPEALQHYTVFSAALGQQATDSPQAQALLRSLTSRQAVDAYANAGLQNL